ncbi:MAG TPA: RNA polymerase sigma factor [Mariprofundaceae bacterium]|nr:RNA polymerase sigma factor [Mariprofundaceae bacterium]
MQEATDEELMQAYRDGNARAFETLYARHKGALFRFMLRSCRTRAIAEELFQEAWLRVIHARNGYQPSAKFSTWLYHIASNLLIDHYRRNGKWDEYLEDDADAVLCVAAATFEQPELRAHANAQIRRLLECLAQLPAPQRQAFLLKEEAGLAIEEIAGTLGAGREAIKSRLRYAVQKLRDCMGELL